jgi:hypothetical protein
MNCEQEFAAVYAAQDGAVARGAYWPLLSLLLMQEAMEIRK